MGYYKNGDKEVWEQISATRAMRKPEVVTETGNIKDVVLEKGDLLFDSLLHLEKRNDVFIEYETTQQGGLREEDVEVELILLYKDASAEAPDYIDFQIGIAKDEGYLIVEDSSIAAGNSDKVSIGGTYGERTVDALNFGARHGGLLIKEWHCDADNDKAFCAPIFHRQYGPSGIQGGGTTKYTYPKASRRDEQTTIRALEKIRALMNGYSTLEVRLYKDIENRITLKVDFYK